MYLCIDTTSSEAGITLVPQGIRSVLDPMNSSEQILVKIDEVLKKASAKPSDLKAIFVIKGPGSFTGLRVGTAVANQFAHQLKIPILGITTEEWWKNRTEEDCIYLQTLNKAEVYSEGKVIPIEEVKGDKWIGQLSDDHRSKLSLTEITDLLSPEETWELLTRNLKLETNKKYDLVVPFYGKEAKITKSTKKLGL